MNVPATGTLSVEGATLYYELRGSGPPLLLIPGGGCDDIDALQAVRDRIILATGRDSAALLPGRPAAVLAGRLGSKIVAFPGGHAGYATDPADFAVRLAGVLAEGCSAAAFDGGAFSAGGST